jgi:hypothetical protein
LSGSLLVRLSQPEEDIVLKECLEWCVVLAQDADSAMQAHAVVTLRYYALV